MNVADGEDMKFASLLFAGLLLAAATPALAQTPSPGADHIAAAQAAAQAGDKPEAFRQMELAAKAGNVLIAYFLGRAYEQGGDVAKDNAKALAYYQQAADGGHLDAEYRIGLRYLNGQGLPRDRDRGVDYLFRADNHGSLPANQELTRIAEAEGRKLVCAKAAIARLGYGPARTSTAMLGKANQFVRASGSGGDLVELYGPDPDASYGPALYSAVRLRIQGYGRTVEKRVAGGQSSVTFQEYEDLGAPSAQGDKDAAAIKAECGL